MKAVIMAGGMGTRLSSLNKSIPKPMFPILGKPILEYQIESLLKSGVDDITIVVGYLKEKIIDSLGNGEKIGITIHYIEESSPLGTAGALYYLKQEKEDFILVFGDLIFDIDFNRFMAFHKSHKALISLYGHPNSHPYDSDLIVIGEGDKVIDILRKKDERLFNYHNFVNAGVYCINPTALNSIIRPEKIDLEKQLITHLIEGGKVYAYRCTEYVKDMGTPDRLSAVEEDIRNGVVSDKSLKKQQKAIFLDRDGTINAYVGFLRKKEDFELLPTVASGISKANKSSFLVIVATNQPVLARGEISFKELDDIHKKMETELGEQGAYIDDLFFCPHHPDKGFMGEVKSLKIDCDCRKPKIGMLIKASEKYNINLSKSWFIGDTTVDIKTGQNAHMNTVLVQTGEAGMDYKYSVRPNYIAKDFLDAITYILNNSAQ